MLGDMELTGKKWRQQDVQSHRFLQHKLGRHFRNVGEINKRAHRSLAMVRGWC